MYGATPLAPQRIIDTVHQEVEPNARASKESARQSVNEGSQTSRPFMPPFWYCGVYRDTSEVVRPLLGSTQDKKK